MRTLGSPAFAALPASAAAGPIFLLSLGAAQAYALVPQPIPIDLGSLAIYLAFALVPAAIFGFVIGFVPNAIGTHVLSKAGETSQTARAPIFWVGIGAALGFGFAVLIGVFRDSPAGTFALVLTSAICAGLCRARTQWED